MYISWLKPPTEKSSFRVLYISSAALDMEAINQLCSLSLTWMKLFSTSLLEGHNGFKMYVESLYYNE